MWMAGLLFVLAGLAEIGGGYMVWLWLKESRPLWYGIVGSLILVGYGILPTLQSFPVVRPRVCRLRRCIHRHGRALGLAGRPQGSGFIRLAGCRGLLGGGFHHSWAPRG